MLEILKIVILSCQISNGSKYYYHTEALKFQKKCRKQVLECISKKTQAKFYYINDQPRIPIKKALSECII